MLWTKEKDQWKVAAWAVEVPYPGSEKVKLGQKRGRTSPNKFSCIELLQAAKVALVRAALLGEPVLRFGSKTFVYWILNVYWEPLEFELPLMYKDSREPLRRWIDTSLDPTQEIVEWENALPVPWDAYHAGPRSVVVLFART